MGAARACKAVRVELFVVKMYSCGACRVDYYHNPEVRVLFSTCDHLVCQPCWKRLFQGRKGPCPACGRSLLAADFSEQALESRQVESETQVRRRICEIYCKLRQHFASEEEYNDYLEEREDIIYALAHPASQDAAGEVWRRVERYSAANAEQILAEEAMRPRRKAQKILGIIEEEGDFCRRVNADWSQRDLRSMDTNEVLAATLHGGEALAAAAPAAAPGAAHPFRERYRSLLSSIQSGPGATAGSTAGAMQPLLQSGGCGRNHFSGDMDFPISPSPCVEDPVRHASGGGQVGDLRLRKARHFFFAGLAPAAAAAAASGH